MRKVEETYVTSGVEKFFLPELPNWANYSIAGKCYKSSSFQYMDFPKISSNYQLDYAQMVELQAQYNERREAYFSSTAYRFLKPVEEASFFSNTLEQVRGGVRHLKLPNVSVVEIIWLEGYLQQNKVEELKKIVLSDRYNEKLPVIFSSCLSRQRLNQWIQENGLGEEGLYLLSAEWLSPFGHDNELHAGLRLEIRRLIASGIKIDLLVPEKAILPIEIVL